MKRYIFVIFTSLFTAVLVISIVRALTNKPAFDFRKSWHYITTTNADFGNLDRVLNGWADGVRNLEWNYQQIDDPNFFQQAGNFFKNVGNFFYNIGIFMGYGLIFVSCVLGYIFAFFVYSFKLFKLFLL